MKRESKVQKKGTGTYIGSNENSAQPSVSVNLPAGVAAVGFGLQPGCMWAGIIVEERLRAAHSQWGHVGVAVGGPEGWGAKGGAQGRRTVSDRRSGVAQHRRVVEGQGSVALVGLVATVRVRRGDADAVAVHARGRAVHGAQESRGARPVWVHLLELQQW